MRDSNENKCILLTILTVILIIASVGVFSLYVLQKERQNINSIKSKIELVEENKRGYLEKALIENRQIKILQKSGILKRLKSAKIEKQYNLDSFKITYITKREQISDDEYFKYDNLKFLKSPTFFKAEFTSRLYNDKLYLKDEMNEIFNEVSLEKGNFYLKYEITNLKEYRTRNYIFKEVTLSCDDIDGVKKVLINDKEFYDYMKEFNISEIEEGLNEKYDENLKLLNKYNIKDIDVE